MKKPAVAKFGAITAAGVCLCTAQGQTSGLSLRLGVFLPTNNLASDLGPNWFAIGADYRLGTMSAKTPLTGTEAYFGISADYYAHGGDNDLPVALTYNIRQGPVRFFGGIGPDFKNASDLGDTGVGIAEQLGVSWDLVTLPMPIFLEAKYFFASDPELSGFGFYAGIRF